MSNQDATSLPEKLLWLADAPLFIDKEHVDRFYDAVVRPANKTGKTTVQLDRETARALSGELGVEGGVSTGDFGGLLTSLLGLKADLRVKSSGRGERKSAKKEGKTLELLPVDTPQRQLVQLALHYLGNHPDRLLRPASTAEPQWRTRAILGRVPRALLFLDLPGQEAIRPGEVETKIIPTAAEFANGKVVQLYSELKSEGGEAAPPYPEPRKDEPYSELQWRRNDYWKWFEANFSATRSVIAIEQAASANGRIRWIDYRVPLTPGGDTLHLHFSPAGEYDTGVFAYYLIKRGFKHGLRLIGTLKSEPDLNVLAVYEK